ncbi:aldo/keto reductase [Limisphaera ngatamarikiensis]|uniref:Aldo/keto reductase n=1 Tax=Limisphaera ngatamarikiensis TaxID=1324935 RepID=A0A6M1REV2_9BACT|nr:aldo/keto reductase [Limisphaera ngatamarikiensis]NGO38126.1 aldo/keto reductase [Limisphaera ngatamarikiensis]
MKPPHTITRREFLTRAAALAGVVVATPALRAAPAPRKTATDQVPLGQTGLKICRLGMGTGSNGGEVQRRLGREGFDRLIRYAYDRGVTYIDTAEAYGTHEYIRSAIRGLPRERLFILTKMPGVPEKPLEVLDRYRKELGVDYLDCVLTHCATNARWDDERRRVLDALEEAKQKGIIRAKGVSCHGLPALRRATEVEWVDVHLVRLNPQGRHIDGPSDRWNEGGNETTLPEVVREIRSMRAKGRGIIGMKIIGNGEFRSPEDREKSIRYAMQSGLVDAVTIGFASTDELDEALERMNRALAEV